jgi:hypothetical protein
MKKPSVKRTNRDQRRDILLMRRLGYSYREISDFLNLSQRAVQYTCNRQQDTPQHKNAGRKSRKAKEAAAAAAAAAAATATPTPAPAADDESTEYEMSDE